MPHPDVDEAMDVERVVALEERLGRRPEEAGDELEAVVRFRAAADDVAGVFGHHASLARGEISVQWGRARPGEHRHEGHDPPIAVIPL
jgi:hypothetical protein